MEEEDGRRRDGRSGRAGRAATRARAAVAMGGEGRSGWLEAVVKWREEGGLELDGVLMRGVPVSEGPDDCGDICCAWAR
jgi:hypothetical protein